MRVCMYETNDKCKHFSLTSSEKGVEQRCVDKRYTKHDESPDDNVASDSGTVWKTTLIYSHDMCYTWGYFGIEGRFF